MTSNGSIKTGVTSSSEIEETNSAKKMRVTFSLDVPTPASPSISENSSSKNEAKVSARAARSLRRQAKIETVAAKVAPRTSSVAMKRGRKQNNTPSKRGKAANDEEVVKIKLNTGILYMYKGLNRRVVFVRRL